MQLALFGEPETKPPRRRAPRPASTAPARSSTLSALNAHRAPGGAVFVEERSVRPRVWRWEGAPANG